MAKEDDILNICGHRNSERLEALKNTPSALCPACIKERIEELEKTLDKIRLISGASYKLPVTSVAAMKNLRIINQRCEQALEGK